ncbi:hypothetical protein R3P38DRAFT_2843091 [Favolaschia claudopus]|uniref:Uncharacterized protein n=1 Tax=Favolaschia claudopus TaxID=2862362 RepID=A0AAW0DYA3_9AGAR
MRPQLSKLRPKFSIPHDRAPRIGYLLRGSPPEWYSGRLPPPEVDVFRKWDIPLVLYKSIGHGSRFIPRNTSPLPGAAHLPMHPRLDAVPRPSAFPIPPTQQLFRTVVVKGLPEQPLHHLLMKIHQGPLEYARLEPEPPGPLDFLKTPSYTLTLSFLSYESAHAFVAVHLIQPSALEAYTRSKTATWEPLPPTPLPQFVSEAIDTNLARRSISICSLDNRDYQGAKKFGPVEWIWNFSPPSTEGSILQNNRRIVQFYGIADAIRAHAALQADPNLRVTFFPDFCEINPEGRRLFHQLRTLQLMGPAARGPRTDSDLSFHKDLRKWQLGQVICGLTATSTVDDLWTSIQETHRDLKRRKSGWRGPTVLELLIEETETSILKAQMSSDVQRQTSPSPPPRVRQNSVPVVPRPFIQLNPSVTALLFRNEFLRWRMGQIVCGLTATSTIQELDRAIQNVQTRPRRDQAMRTRLLDILLGHPEWAGLANRKPVVTNLSYGSKSSFLGRIPKLVHLFPSIEAISPVEADAEDAESEAAGGVATSQASEVEDEVITAENASSNSDPTSSAPLPEKKGPARRNSPGLKARRRMQRYLAALPEREGSSTAGASDETSAIEANTGEESVTVRKRRSGNKQRQAKQRFLAANRWRDLAGVSLAQASERKANEKAAAEAQANRPSLTQLDLLIGTGSFSDSTAETTDKVVETPTMRAPETGG